MIRRIGIKDFRSHKETVIDLDRQITYIGGVNGAGKTTIGHALMMGVLDRCPVTDQRGQFKDQLIRHGAEDYEIRLELDNEQVIIRNRERATGLGYAKPTDLMRAIEEKLASKPVLQTLLGGSFFSLGDADQRNLILGMAAVVLSDQEFKKFLAQRLGEQLPLVKDKLAGFNGDSPTGLDNCYTGFYAWRKDANKAVETAEGKLAVLGTDDVLKFDMEAWKTEAATVTATADQLYSLINQGGKTVSSEDVDKQKAKLTELESLIKKANPPKDVGKAIEVAMQRGSTVKEKQRASLSERARIELEINQQEQLAALATEGGDCPSCGATLTADSPTVKAAADNRDQLKVRLDTINNDIKELEDEEGMATARLSELRAYKDILLPQLSTIKGWIDWAANQTTSEQMATWEEQLEAAREAVNAHERETLPLKQKRDEYDAVVDSLPALRDTAAAYNAVVKSVEVFKAERVEGKIKELLDRINAIAAPLGMQFNLDPASLLVGNDQGLTFRSLSESEQVKFDAVFRIALASGCNFNFLVIDRADVLDDQGRIGLLDTLIKNKVRAVVLAKSDNREKFTPPGHKRIKWLWVSKDDQGVSHVEEA